MITTDPSRFRELFAREVGLNEQKASLEGFIVNALREYANRYSLITAPKISAEYKKENAVLSIGLATYRNDADVFSLYMCGTSSMTLKQMIDLTRGTLTANFEGIVLGNIPEDKLADSGNGSISTRHLNLLYSRHTDLPRLHKANSSRMRRHLLKKIPTPLHIWYADFSEEELQILKKASFIRITDCYYAQEDRTQGLISAEFGLKPAKSGWRWTAEYRTASNHPLDGSVLAFAEKHFDLIANEFDTDNYSRMRFVPARQGVHS